MNVRAVTYADYKVYPPCVVSRNVFNDISENLTVGYHNLNVTRRGEHGAIGAEEILLLDLHRIEKRVARLLRERGIEALLNTAESIPNADELLVKVGALAEMLEQKNEQAVPDDVVGEEAEESLVGDLGGGVT